MVFILADLEWNGAYSKKAHGYFNEIIEIGAVKLDEHMRQLDTFHAVIRPVVSRKLSDIVSELTNITVEELEDGGTFPGAMSAMRRWIGKEEAALLTWSNTDLTVLTENCRYFLQNERPPFMRWYADAQAYCQTRLDTPKGQQIGLSRACEQLGISAENMALHRALDDSLLTAEVLRQLYDAAPFRPFLQRADDTFYERLHFKSYIINDLADERVPRESLRFTCETCGKPLKPMEDWRFRNRAFCAPLYCRRCDKRYTARVQVKVKYEGPEIKRRLAEQLPAEETGESVLDSEQKIST